MLSSLRPPRSAPPFRAPTAVPATVLTLAVLALAGCAGSGHSSTSSHSTVPDTTATSTLPGTGKPPVTIGDKNFTEQFVLGELYYQALLAQGFSVSINRNIGPTEVTIPALESGRLDMYPEYLGTWNSAIAGLTRTFGSRVGAYRSGQQFALAHGLQLLAPTPFSDTDAIAVTRAYAVDNHLKSLGDLRKVATSLTLGAPPQFQQAANALPAIEQAYGFVPEAFKTLDVGAQYQALDQGTVQAADVNTTDAELTTGKYSLLSDPLRLFGWGNVVPVVSAKTLTSEGPAFAQTIDKVSSLLSTDVMRQLNAAVDIYHGDPATVAKQFLQQHGLLTTGSTP